MNPLIACGAAAALLALPSIVHAAEAAEGFRFHGLLRARDLTPFGFLRLDMRPAHAIAIKPRTWALETEVAYQNTWALSPEVETYLTGREAQGRRELGPADVDAIRALPGENYLLDVESASIDVTVHYRLSSAWSAYLITSAVSYGGGFMDGMIESFHDVFGFSSFGRPATARNDVNLVYDLKGAQVSSFGTPTRGGFTDPTVGIRYVGIQVPENWSLALEAAAKLPVRGQRLLLSTGHTDYGLQAYLQRRARRHAFYLDVSTVYYAGAEEPVPQDSEIIPTLIIGYERRLTDRTNINLQLYASESVYSRDETDLDALLDHKYQLTLGVRHRVGNLLLSFGATENLQNFNNTPDIGFQLGLAYVPERVLRE
jgi:hypothetical protein